MESNDRSENLGGTWKEGKEGNADEEAAACEERLRMGPWASHVLLDMTSGREGGGGKRGCRCCGGEAVRECCVCLRMLYCGVECEAIDRATHRRVCWAAGEEAPPVVCSSEEAMRWTAAMLQECGVKRLCRADIVDMGPAKLASAIASGVVTVRMATSLALALAPLNIQNQLQADEKEKEKAKSEEQQAEMLEGDGKKQLAWISDLIHRVLSRGDKECVAIRQDDCHQYAAEAVFCNLRMEDRRQRTAGVPRLYCLAHPKRKRGWKGSFETLAVVLVPQSQGQPILIDVGLASEKGYRFRDVNKAICSVALGYALLRSLESVGGLMVGL